VIIGKSAGTLAVSSDNNTMVGYSAGGGTTSGYDNTFIGGIAGSLNTTGYRNTYLGYSARGAITLTNQTAIGYDAIVYTSNTIVLGNNVVDTLRCNASLSSLSDERFKKDIEIETDGLDFIKQLQCKKYKMKHDINNKIDNGFMAQDINLIKGNDNCYVDNSVPSQLGIKYSKLIVPTINAVKELSIKNDILEAIVGDLVKRMEKMEKKE